MGNAGSLVLFNRKDVHSFRGDSHNWRKRANRNTVKEGHENLKVGGVHALACYYAHGADNPNFCRRIYWMLENKDIVLVHYRDTTEFPTSQSHTTTRTWIDQVTPSSNDVYGSSSVEIEMYPDPLSEENGKQSNSFGCQIINGTLEFGSGNSVKDFDQGATLQEGEYIGREDGISSDLIDSSVCGTTGQAKLHLGVDPNFTAMPEQKFTGRKVSPDWSFANEITKDGVICCEAPSNYPGKVTFCITSGNGEYYSEVKEFEYHDRNSACSNCSKLKQEEERRMEEAKLLVEFVGMLFSGSSLQKGENDNFCIGPSRMQNEYEYSTGYNVEALLKGHRTSFGIIDWVLQEVLKDKLQQWFATRFLQADNNSNGILSKKERGIIHLVAGLGYEWALKPILDYGVGVNFRDTNGWTALHWAARFGREDMVGALIARGASVSAVTDPTAQDPMGKNVASVADANGHKGLAAYLSASALTTRLSDHGFEVAEVEVSKTQNEFSASNEDEIWMKQVLEVNDKASRAAELIQTAFRRKQQREAANRGEVDEYGLTCDETHRVSAALFKKRNTAAVTIQKNYKGWKRRTLYKTMSGNVIKIQAHVRGYRIRKYYRVIRVVSIMEKIMLRWRYKRIGLRGFKLPGGEAMDENEEEEEEDILRDLSRRKMDSTVNEAVRRVRSLVDCRQARGQYSRMLQAFRVAKDKLDVGTKEGALDSLNGIVFGENDTAHDTDVVKDTPASPDCLEMFFG